MLTRAIHILSIMMKLMKVTSRFLPFIAPKSVNVLRLLVVT